MRIYSIFPSIYFALILLTLLPVRISAQDSVIRIEEGLIIPTINSYVRSSLYIDPIEGSLIKGAWKRPKAGDEVEILGKTQQWETIETDSAGWFQDRRLRGGYLYARVHSERDSLVFMENMSAKWVYVNGEIRVGNRYQAKEKFESWEPQFNFYLMPIQLKKGWNEFLFKCNRGRLKVNFHPGSSGLNFNFADVTLPDIISGKNAEMWGAVVIMNAQDKAVEPFQIVSSLQTDYEVVTDVGYMPPFSVRKVPFRIQANGWGRKADSKMTLILRIIEKDHAHLGSSGIPIAIKDGQKQHNRTYRSSVDGSVQYYAVKPATDPGPQSLVLSVHGANVEASNQAGSYHPKSWAHIVSPTNRRPYGYNWEDWGRIDAMEVLDRAQQVLEVDPNRVYLTGHSMGGHGTWVLGSTYPDRFAAIGPSAGYLRVGAYYGRFFSNKVLLNPPMLDRAKNQTFTDSLLTNLKGLGVYAIHGGADRVVKPEQTYRALEILKKFHKDYQYHEEPDKGHWWDISDESGADCVDWQPLFDFYARKARPGTHRIREIDFRTAHPGVSASHYWATLYDQQKYLEFSRMQLRFDPGKNRIEGSTENVKILALDVQVLDRQRKASITLDEQTFTIDWASLPVSDKLYFIQKNGGWKLKKMLNPNHKGPHRYGTFKSAIEHHVVFVYGTAGNTSENAWAMQKARFDAESFWYQGNGSIPIIPDHAYSSEAYEGRNVVLYGNATTNLAWPLLLADSPVQASRNSLSLDGKALPAADQAVLFIRPMAGSQINSVAVVGGTSLKGMRLTNTLPYLYQNFALPDVLVYGMGVIGNKAPTVTKMGYFGSDWTVRNGEWE